MITIICLIVGKLPLPEIHTIWRGTDRSSETAQSAANVRAEDWSAPPAGLEPATVCLEGSCSIRLSYGGIAVLLHNANDESS